MKLTRLGTYIIERNMNTTITSKLIDLGADLKNAASTILIKFTGCTASTNIGTMWLTVAASI